MKVIGTGDGEKGKKKKKRRKKMSEEKTKLQISNEFYNHGYNQALEDVRIKAQKSGVEIELSLIIDKLKSEVEE